MRQLLRRFAAAAYVLNAPRACHLKSNYKGEKSNRSAAVGLVISPNWNAQFVSESTNLGNLSPSLLWCLLLKYWLGQKIIAFFFFLKTNFTLNRKFILQSYTIAFFQNGKSKKVTFPSCFNLRRGKKNELCKLYIKSFLKLFLVEKDKNVFERVFES